MSGPGELHLLHSADLRPADRESEQLVVRLQPVGPRIRLPIWRLPVHCRRDVWYPRPQPELGVHDTQPGNIW